MQAMPSRSSTVATADFPAPALPVINTALIVPIIGTS
jgi:hypothetical protein